MCDIDKKQLTTLRNIRNAGRPKLYNTEDEVATAKRECSNKWYQQNKEKRISRIKLYQQQNRDTVNLQRRIRYAEHKTQQQNDNIHNC